LRFLLCKIPSWLIMFALIPRLFHFAHKLGSSLREKRTSNIRKLVTLQRDLNSFKANAVDMYGSQGALVFGGSSSSFPLRILSVFNSLFL